jgi:hypothetical protein
MVSVVNIDFEGVKGVGAGGVSGVSGVRRASISIVHKSGKLSAKGREQGNREQGSGTADCENDAQSC